MAIKTLRVFAEYTSTGFVPMPTAGNIDYGYTLASTFPSSTPSSFQTDDPDLDVTVTAMTDFYVWIRINGTAWNPSYTRNVRVYPDSPDINNVVMNMIIATGPAGTSAYSQIVQTSNRLYFNGATTDSVYNSKFAGKTYINELNFGTAPGLATVATTGAYADLTGKPALSTVATSGSYADLSNKPSGTAPISYNSGTNSFQISVASASTNGYLTSTDWSTFNAKYLLPSGGTTAQYLRGDGTLATFPTTLDSTRLIFTGKNTTGATLAKGTVVYINGVSGNTALLAKAIASGDSTSAQTLGVVEFDIANNQSGIVVLVGAVNNLDTSSYTEGVQLYLSGTTAGAFTSSKVLAPTHLVYVGIVTRAHPTQGTIEVKVQNGYELDEIHDVQISSPANKDILYHDTASSLWKHASIATVLGYTPYNATNPNNYIALTALSASAPLSYNNTTGAFTISQANTTTNGFLSSTDWNTFNSKQNALTLGNVSEVSSNVLMFPDGGTGKTIGNLSIQVIQAGASTNGYLSSTDWSTFNSKQSAITLTTTGTSGASTFASNTLNIPQYQGVVTLTTTGTSGAATFSANTLNIPQYSTDISGLVTLTTTQTISGAKTFSTVLNGTSGIFGSDFLTNETSKIGISFAGGFGQINSWGANTSTYGGLKFQISASNGGTINALTISPLGASTFSRAVTIGDDTLTALTVGRYSAGIPIAYIKASAGSTGGFRLTNHNGADVVVVNGSNNLTIDSPTTNITGNVGIGTSSPLSRLDVSSGALTGALIVGGDFNTSTGARTNATRKYAILGVPHYTNAEEPMTFAVLNSGLGVNEIIIGGAAGNLNAATSIEFYTAANNTTLGGTERMRITSDGNVGISVTPQSWYSGYVALQLGNSAALYANRTSADAHVTILSNNAYLNTSVNWIYSVNARASRYQQNDGDHVFSYAASGTAGNTISWSNALVIRNSGNTLLGTFTDNGERLYVIGAIRATGNITANSDLVLKKNLTLVDNPIDKLNQLNGYLYQWKENDEYQYGVIAQEVEKILPHAVQTGKNGIKGVSYNQIIPLLIEVAKEQNKKIIALEAKLG
jgi:hypothetical protein